MKYILELFRHEDEDALCLLRVCGADGGVSVPEAAFIPGYGLLPVVSLSDYAFSENAALERRILGADGKALFCFDDRSRETVPLSHMEEASRAKLCGEAVICGRLQSAALPASLQKIGRYAFYNCSNLASVSMYSETTDLGQGLFTGCTAVRRLDFVVNEHSRSSLFDTLSELRYPIRVTYRIRSEKTDNRFTADFMSEYTAGSTDGRAPSFTDEYTAGSTEEHAPGFADEISVPAASQLKYRLIFPEYYENAAENTPARITVRDLRGSGLMYRNCFSGTQLQIERYDSLFSYAEALEPESVTAELALCRLEAPADLKEETKQKYCGYLLAHPKALFSVLLLHLNEEILRISDIRRLLSKELHAPALLSSLIDFCSSDSSPEAARLLPLLMELYASGAQFQGGFPEAGAGPDAKMPSKSDRSSLRRRHFEL